MIFRCERMIVKACHCIHAASGGQTLFLKLFKLAQHLEISSVVLSHLKHKRPLQAQLVGPGSNPRTSKHGVITMAETTEIAEIAIAMERPA